MEYFYTKEEYLAHHGILGMKWGVRRYQNEDGTLTEEGKKRYAQLEGKIAKQERKIEKYQRKVDSKSSQYLRAERKKAKAARLKNRAMNSWFMSNSKRAKLSTKADRLAAKAAKMQNNTLKNEAKIKRAQAFINRYNRKLDKLDPSRANAGARYINGYANISLSELNKKILFNDERSKSSFDKDAYMKKRNSFKTDEEKDIWESTVNLDDYRKKE